MAKQRRSFSVDQKLQIIQEARELGVTVILRKHNLSNSVYNRWKDQFDSGGVKGLKRHAETATPEVKALQEENDRLKKIVAKQALEIEVKTELLKKTALHNKSK
jgi:transposase-like protein